MLDLSEDQKMFEMKNKFGISVTSDLGDTPFHECFDPQVQLVFEDQGNSVEFYEQVRYCMVKKSCCERKYSSTKEIYALIGKKLIQIFGVDENDDKVEKEEEEMAKFQGEFTKARKIYKCSIILLLIVLIITCNVKYRNMYPKKIFMHFLIKKVVLIVLVLLLFFFLNVVIILIYVLLLFKI